MQDGVDCVPKLLLESCEPRACAGVFRGTAKVGSSEPWARRNAVSRKGTLATLGQLPMGKARFLPQEGLAAGPTMGPRLPAAQQEGALGAFRVAVCCPIPRWGLGRPGSSG